jgi:hypothetical protein
LAGNEGFELIAERDYIDIDYNVVIIIDMIKTTQKIIQIGSSQGVTLSKKDLLRLGAKRGDTLKLTVQLVPEDEKQEKLLSEYNNFLSKYGQTLKNLADK